MFKLRIFTIWWQHLAYFDFDGSNMSQKSWNGGVGVGGGLKDGKVSGAKKNILNKGLPLCKSLTFKK